MLGVIGPVNKGGHAALGFRVEGLVQGLGFRFQGLGFRFRV